jgi:ATP-dependent DNA helicase RecG
MPQQELKNQKLEFEALKAGLRDPIHRARSQRYKEILQLSDVLGQLSLLLQKAPSLPPHFHEKLKVRAQAFDEAHELAKPMKLEALVQTLQQDAPWSDTESPDMNTWRTWSAQPLTLLKGVGQARSRQFSAEGFENLGDLLLNMPRNYIVWVRHDDFSSIEPGDPVVTFGEVVKTGFRFGRGRQRRFEVTLQDEEMQQISLVFFNYQQKTMQNRFAVGQVVTVCGEALVFRQRLQISHPKSAPGIVPHRFEGMMPIYSERGLLKKETVAKMIQTALHTLPDEMADPLPALIAKEFQFPPFAKALREMHTPQAKDVDELQSLQLPRNRFIFTELLCAQLSLIQLQNSRKAKRSQPIKEARLETIEKRRFAFALTQAQSTALKDILRDMAQTAPMGRLLQGDVGSGKTAVAIGACDAVISHQMQCAVMAPTEILAEQHFDTFQKSFSEEGVHIALLTSSTKTALRKQILNKLHTGDIDILIGTHSLLNDKVVFQQLGLTIVDEQHRFGVSQRAKLRIKGLQSEQHMMPHFLAMTATPIPRSLALTLYGDLELSILNEMPPGRLPVKTSIVDQNAQHIIEQELQAICNEGQKAFIVYPLIEESEKIDLHNAMTGFENLKQVLKGRNIGLLHGRLSAQEKEETIQAFKQGLTDILVSTTVVEVGVDVPDATLMIIMNAERFGLSQLHQLRGRVGRSSLPSRCLLIPGENQRSQKAQQRLAVLTESNDGFLIAAQDLQIRGPGDFLGTRQAGLPSFAFADPIRDAQLLSDARKWAKIILQRDPYLENKEHQEIVALMQRLQLEGLTYTEAG